MKFTNTPIFWFRLIAFLEGMSFLILLFIAVPLKYLMDIPEPTKVMGSAHGALFVAYVLLCLVCYIRYKWKISTFFILIALSFVPFGTFWGDKKYLRAQN
jgi:integral membrane protein